MTAFERFVAEHNISIYRIERLGVYGNRRRLIVDYRGRELAVSFIGEPGHHKNAAISKLAHAIREMAA